MFELFWIAFGDVHERLKNIHKIDDISMASGILMSGDLTNVGNLGKVSRLMEEVKKLNPNVYAQIGNMDTREVEEYLDQTGMNIHARVIPMVGGVHLTGLGYSTPTPFSTPSEVEEEQLKLWLDSVEDQAMEPKHLIFLTHTPPYRTKADLLKSGSNVGSRAVREFIEKVQPGVCVTGHIHEARSVDRIGKTLIINPGPLSSGGYVRISFSGSELDAQLRMVQ
ncbi:metallophosphoesterase [Desulfonatronovibrio hydrogenovorans]|uniref:metallophosphoesterase n=1 Tax=Desulfonatronovibrio hydrogenovorans TaxID=53245 RepID=UPI0004911126|nr:metallophosphoesterase [Desulfonatronovibrio hydrogenovorans]